MKTCLGLPLTFAWPLGTAVWERLLFWSLLGIYDKWSLNLIELKSPGKILTYWLLTYKQIPPGHLSHMQPIRAQLSDNKGWKHTVCMVVVLKKWEFISVRIGQQLSSTLHSIFSTVVHCHTFLIQNAKLSKKCGTHWPNIPTREIGLQERWN